MFKSLLFASLILSSAAAVADVNPYNEKLLSVLYSQNRALIAYRPSTGGLNYMDCAMDSGVMVQSCERVFAADLKLNDATLAAFNSKLAFNLNLAAFGSRVAQLPQVKYAFGTLSENLGLQVRLLKDMYFDGKTRAQAAGHETLRLLSDDERIAASVPLKSATVQNLMLAAPTSLEQSSTVNEFQPLEKSIDLNTVKSALDLSVVQ